MGSTQGNTVNRFDGNFDLDELEDQCLFDGAFATKWVQPREMLLLALTGKWGGFVCFVLEVEKGL
jgi:hypothetical protein